MYSPILGMNGSTIYNGIKVEQQDMRKRNRVRIMFARKSIFLEKGVDTLRGRTYEVTAFF